MSVAFLYTNYKQPERELMKPILFIIALEDSDH